MKGSGIFDDITGAVGNLINPKTAEETTNEKLKNTREENSKSVKDFMDIQKKKKLSKDKIEKAVLDTERKPTNLSQKEECIGKKLNIEFDKSDTLFQEFIRNHEKMTQDYLRFNKTFLDLIDNNLILLTKDGYELKKIDETILDNMEKETRKTLVEYYTTCQKTFTESFALLVEAVDESGIQKAKNNSNNESQNNEIKEVKINNEKNNDKEDDSEKEIKNNNEKEGNNKESNNTTESNNATENSNIKEGNNEKEDNN